MTLQTFDPSQAIITSVGDAVGGGIADSIRPVITGTADAGDTVVVYDGIRVIGSALAASDGTWVLLPTADLKIGQHSFAAIAQDDLGNFGASSAVVKVAVTDATLAAPVLTDVTTWQGNAVPFGGITNESEPTVSGSGASGDTVALYDGAYLVGKAVVDNSGHWSIDVGTKLVDGNHDLYAIETNAAGAHSAQSNHASFAVDTTTPAVPVVLGVMDNVGPVQGVLAYGATTDDAHPVFFGTGHPGDVITLSENQFKGPWLGSTVVAADGTWSVQPTAALPDGLHVLHVTATNSAGTTGPATGSANMLIIDTTTPAVPAITSVADSLGSVIAAGGTTDITLPVISGNGQPGHIVNVYDGSTLIGSSNVDGYGHWSVQTVNALSASVHNLSAIDLNKAGVPSAPSAHFLFLIDAPVLKSVMHVSETADHTDVASVTGHETVGQNVDSALLSHPVSAQSAVASDDAHVHATSDHAVLDLSALPATLAASTGSAAATGNLADHHVALKLSLVDVLGMGERDLFQKDGNQQLMINGKEGDTVELSNSHVAGLADGEWHQNGTAQVSGVTYNVYEHTGAHAELLVQQNTQIALH